MQEKEKRGSSSLVLKAGFWYVISTFLIKGLSFITTPIFSRLLSKEAYGEFSNFASWQSLLLIITSAEMYSTVARAYYDYKDDFDRYVSSVTIASCGVTLIFYVLFLVFGDWIRQVVAIPEEFVHVLFFTLMFQACKQIYMARERTLYRYKSVAVISVVNLLIPTLIAVVLVLLAQEPQRLSARIYGFYVPSALIGVGCAAVLLWRGRRFSLKHCRYAFVLSIPLMAHYLTAHLLTSSNTIVTKLVLGTEAVSSVSIASSTNHILTILWHAVSGALTTWLMDQLEEKNERTARKGTLLYVAGVAVVSIGVMLLAPELIWILGGAKYADSVVLMPGMVTAVFVQSITMVFTIILTYRKKVFKTALFTGIVSVLGVAAKYFLLPYAGIQVLPFVNAAAFGILLVINYFLIRRYGCGRYVNVKGMLAVVGAELLVMAGCYFLYRNTLIRYCAIGVIMILVCAVMYKYRRPIMRFVRKKLKKKTNKNVEE
ncbi:MAG: oligosaccharide flippase family protein [Clostridia bacterium]|nr:oligosaccharide flippase family protein [Clostridia bacterium]